MTQRKFVFFSAAVLSALAFSAYAAKKTPDKKAIERRLTNNTTQPGYGPAAANNFLKTMTVPEGFEVTIWASEPLLRNPTSMDIDERGRVWVLETVNYGAAIKPWGVRDPAGDRVVLLEDTNHDGLADSRKVFYQNPDINSPYGIGVFGNKIMACASPNVFLLTDTNDDGKFDSKQLFFGGVGGHDRDHSIHAFVFGPDGKFYFNFGNRGGQLKRADGTYFRDIEGREINVPGTEGDHSRQSPWKEGAAFRCNPDGSAIEVLAYNFRNPQEVGVDSFGTMWQADNDDDGWKGTRVNYVMEFGNFGYVDEMTGAGWRQPRSNLEEEIPRRHWHQNDPGVVPNLLNTGAGAPAGICVYEGELMPQLRGQFIYAESGNREIRAVSVEPDAAGYRAKYSVFLTSSSTWFRPSDVCVGTDGALYVADWHDGIVGGHDVFEQEIPKMTGRIYRIAPKGKKVSAPKFDFANASGCVEALKNPNLATRYQAWTKLNALQNKAEKELLKLWSGDDAVVRARALQLLARIKGAEQKYLAAGIKDRNPQIRIVSLRIARALQNENKITEQALMDFVKQLARDNSPQVRRECAIALRHKTSLEAAKLWTALALQHDGKDRWYLEALGIGADAQWEKFFDVWLAAAGEKWNTPAGRDIIWRSRSTKTAPLLAKLINDKNVPEKERQRYFRAMDFVPPSPEKDQALIELLSAAK
jgi:putative membrane-bound dehydrogenase-like protein